MSRNRIPYLIVPIAVCHLLLQSHWSLMRLTFSYVDDPEFTEMQVYADVENRGRAGRILHRVLKAIF